MFDLYKGADLDVTNWAKNTNQGPKDLTLATVISLCLQALELTYYKKTGDIANTTNTILNLSDIVGLAPGMPIYGVGIPSGTTINSVSGTTVVMSQNATATTPGLTIGFGFIEVVTPITGETIAHFKSAATATLQSGKNVDIGFSYTVNGVTSKYLAKAACNIFDDPC